MQFKLTELASSGRIKKLVFGGEGIGYLNEVVDFTPKRATSGSNGYDLRACIEQPITLSYHEVAKIPTGVLLWPGSLQFKGYIETYEVELGEFVALSVQFAGLLLPRSSNPGLKLENTVRLLDADYQGEIFFKYRNTSEDLITIKPGDAIGQLLLVPSVLPELVQVQEFSLPTERGNNGFGSTGK